MKKKLVMITLIVVTFVQTLMAIPIQNDIALQRLQELKILENKQIELNKEIKRGEIIDILIKFMGKEEIIAEELDSCIFVDVPENVQPYINYLYNEKVIMGNGSDKFNYDQYITLKEFMIMILRILGYTDLKWNSEEMVNECNKLLEEGELQIEEAEFNNILTYNQMISILNTALYIPHKDSGVVQIQLLEEKYISTRSE